MVSCVLYIRLYNNDIDIYSNWKFMVWTNKGEKAFNLILFMFDFFFFFVSNNNNNDNK